ncbi:MAG: hypothetical protein ACK5Q5_02640 [Planctomycetaceae bacterium]
MKVEITIPDDLFHAAEDLATHLAMPRSELYSQAISEFLAAHNDEQITLTLNGIYGNETSEVDLQLSMMQLMSFKRTSW